MPAGEEGGGKRSWTGFGDFGRIWVEEGERTGFILTQEWEWKEEQYNSPTLSI